MDSGEIVHLNSIILSKNDLFWRARQPHRNLFVFDNTYIGIHDGALSDIQVLTVASSSEQFCLKHIENQVPYENGLWTLKMKVTSGRKSEFKVIWGSKRSKISHLEKIVEKTTQLLNRIRSDFYFQAWFHIRLGCLSDSVLKKSEKRVPDEIIPD